ncbi:MAG: hypothetical protein Q4D19_04710 [Lautropia sp.]|nr:hypothetical protein [Lautropia sp.]
MFQIPLPLAQLVLSAFNHVIRQQPSLQQSLRPHAGQVLRIRVLPPAGGGQGASAIASSLPTLESDARIGADGALSAIPADQPAVVLTVSPSVDALFAALRQGPQALGASLRIEGNVMLASALGEVAKALHWDVEEDLSRVVGDVAAHRIGQAVREARERAAGAGERLHELVGDHLASDRGVLASRTDMDEFSAMLRRLDIRVTLLERDLPAR